MIALSEVKLISLKRFFDERGFFEETYRKSSYKIEGIATTFVQTNHSFSKKGVIRGMHFQSGPGQAKLVTVIGGAIFDVFVDIRPDSPNFGKWSSQELDSENPQQLFIPAGFAHGFAVLSESVHVIYQMDTFFDPAIEKTFRYDDPDVGVEWPVDVPILSEKDRHAPSFKEVIL